jgi:predicted ribosomally synthesized peptide with SipW-like signal peptide
MNKQLIISLSIIGVVAAIAIGGTIAYFSDTETSTGNTFTAGTLDLKVDNTCYYNDQLCLEGTGFDTTWTESDLVPGVHKFFYLTDIKPGDDGEDTISLHVYNNDAWGKLVIGNIVDTEGSPACTEPELKAEEGVGKCSGAPGCFEIQNQADCEHHNYCIWTVGCPHAKGELRQNLKLSVWLDEGATPGFQGQAIDTTEGDNIKQAGEFELITPGPVDLAGEIWNLYDGLKAAYQTHSCTGGAGNCSGLTADGHMVGSITYYFGVAWELPTTVGNEVQSDVFGGDMTLQVVQYRNNVDPAGGPISW